MTDDNPGSAGHGEDRGRASLAIHVPDLASPGDELKGLIGNSERHKR